MPKFSEIFRKLDPSEYNKYSFMLAVKKESEPCFNPIYLDGRSRFVDRAFITIAGGLSKSPEDPCAPLRRPEPEKECAHDDYIYTEPFIKAASKPDETYDYWVAKGDTPVSLSLFHRAIVKINEALEYREVKDGEITVEPTARAKIELVETADDPESISVFIRKAEVFLAFELNNQTECAKLDEILRELYNAAVDLQDTFRETEVDCHAKYDFDTGGYIDENSEFVLSPPHPINFDQGTWNETFNLLDKISDFEFGKKFAYYDIAGPRQHIAALGDILSQRSHCLFYPKWQELFAWYSMRPISFDMAICDIEPQRQNGEFLDWDNFLSLCFFDMSQTKKNYSFLINNTGTWEWKSFAKNSCSSTGCYHHSHYIPPANKQKLLKSPCWLDPLDPKRPYWETPRWTASKTFCYDPQIITILTNLYYICNCAKKEIEDTPDQEKNIKDRVQTELDSNFSITARAIRVFCENVLLALYKIGRVPGLTSYCTDSSGTGKYWCNDKLYEYYMGRKNQDRIESSAVRTKNRNGDTIQVIDEAYKDPNHHLSCRQDIVDLFDIVNPEMHATGKSPEFAEYADILRKIEEISKEVLGLLKNAGVS